jgi:hypothetical protein
VNTQQAMSLLRHQLPEFDHRSAAKAQVCGRNPEHSIDVYDFAMFVTELREQADDPQVHAAFALVEQFLVAGTAEVRDWVCAWIEALQNVASWRRCGIGAFRTFLGRQTRALWDGLEKIRCQSLELDFAGCSVLEAEVLAWRLTRERTRALAFFA